MTIIEQIKAEVERRLKNTRDYMNGAGMKYKGPKYHASRGRESAYDAILSFLSTLESEKPMQEELEEEIQHQVYDLLFDLDGVAIKGATAYATVDDVAYIARHFAQWGAEHLASTGKTSPKELEEAAVSFSKIASDGHNDCYLRVGFIAGAKWQADNAPLPEDTVIWNDGFKTGREVGARDMKEQMMKEWLKDRDGCFWDGVNEGKKAKEGAILAIIESRLSEIIGDAQPKPVLRAELEELIKRIKNDY